MKSIILFIKHLIFDYKIKSELISSKDKLDCYKRVFVNLISSLWSIISSPFIYPIWWVFRKEITLLVYQNTSWEEISSLISTNQTDLVKSKLKSNGWFLYWLWTYGDQENPLVNGGMPGWYGKNNFWNRFSWAAIRNPRFNINYLEFRTSVIIDVVTIIDNRNFNLKHVSRGISDSPDGIYFKWMKDKNDKWYFIYENNNQSFIWYFGWTGLLYNDVGNTGGRFEFSLRKTESSYQVDY